MKSFSFLHGTGQDEGRIPAAGDAHTAQVQSLLQLGRVGGILVADLAAGEAGQSHLADGLLEGVLGPSPGISSLHQPMGAIPRETVFGSNIKRHFMNI